MHWAWTTQAQPSQRLAPRRFDTLFFAHGPVSLTKDPARSIVEWLVEGAPAGIARDIPDLGVFPTKTDDSDISVAELDAIAGDLHNYDSLEQYVNADAVIAKLCDPSKEWARTVKTMKQARRILGGKPVINPHWPRRQREKG